MHVDDRTRQELGADGLAEVTATLWPVDCQTCNRPFGGETPSLVVQDLHELLFVDLHHRTCEEPGWKDLGPIEVHTTLPTLSSATRLVNLPLVSSDGERVPWPLMIVNPGLESVMLERDPTSAWRVIIEAEFTDVGLVPPGEALQLDRHDAIRDAHAALIGDDVVITLPPPMRRTFSCPLGDSPADAALIRHIRQMGGLLVGITHWLNPSLLTGLTELEPVFAGGQIVLGWIAFND